VAVGAAALAGPAALLSAPTTAAFAGNPSQSGLPATLQPGKLLVSISQWQQNAAITAGTTQLPPGCGSAAAPCSTAVADGTYPFTFNNDQVDGSFGITQPILLEQINPSSGKVMGVLVVPENQMVTSFSSKSELALNQSTAGTDVTFMGYEAGVGTVDVSNSNTPGAVDATNSAGPLAYYRVVGDVNRAGQFQFTATNAYSGNNGRAAILDNATGTIFTAGNAGNGANPEPQSIVEGVGSQILSQSAAPGTPTPFGNFNVTQLGYKADKSAKDDNFRGLAVYNGVVYLSKGSGGNGIDTVYFVDTTGAACPTGVGVPGAAASLPSATSWISPTFSTNNAALGLTPKNPGLEPTNMCVLAGFPTTLAKNATNASDYPFGIWFANPDTMYVADEGSGDATFSAATGTYTAAAASTTAGLQKWVFDPSTGMWNLAYTIQSGLNLGTPYSVADAGGNSYPTGENTYVDVAGNTVDVGPWAPANDGLRNLTGRVNANGTVTLWATTSTVSGSGDQGADPNSLVTTTDPTGATTLPAGESFSTVVTPTYGQVVRGVSMTPAGK
jgi:hypothetical protein